MEINELGYTNEPLAVEEPIAAAPLVPEGEPQGDPEKKKKKDMVWEEDSEAVLLGLYNDGKPLGRARKIIANQYKWKSKDQMQSVVDFYAVKDAEKKNLGGSESGGSTSGGSDGLDNALGAYSGTDSLASGYNNIGSAIIIGGNTHDVPNEEYTRKYGKGMVYRFGAVREGETKDDIQILLDNNGDNPYLLNAMDELQKDAFQRWVFKEVDGNPLFASMLNRQGNEDVKELFETTNLVNPLIFHKELVMDLLARASRDYKKDLQVDGYSFPIPITSARSLQKSYDEPAEKTLKGLNTSFMDFYGGMIKDSLPNRISRDDEKLKDLEYIFKVTKGYSFDLTGEGTVGNQDFWEQTGGHLKIMGLTVANMFSWLSMKLGKGMQDSAENQESKRQAIDERKDRIEAVQMKMNSYKKNITENVQAWWNSGGETDWDWDLLRSGTAQSYGMMIEASPYVVGAGLMAYTGASPLQMAFGMSTYGATQDAMLIENNIQFDKFVDKETGEVYTYHGDDKRDGAINMIDYTSEDTREDIDRKILEKFDLQRNDENRLWYLTKTFATGFVADRVTFGIFNRAMQKATTGGLLRYGKPMDIAKEVFKGMGIAVPQGALGIFPDAYMRALSEGVATGDPDLDAENAFKVAIEVTLGTLPLGSTMFGLGWAKGKAIHFSKSRVGRDGMNVYHREQIAALMKVVNNKRVSYTDRMNARREILHMEQEGRIRQQDDANFYDYVSRKKPSDMDEIGRLNIQIERTINSMNTLSKAPKVMGLDGNEGAKAVYKKALDSLIQKKGAIEESHRAGYEASKGGGDPATKTEVKITASKTIAKQSLIDGGVKKPTPSQVTEEQVRLSEVDFRKTPEWVTKNIEDKPNTTLTEESLRNLLNSEKFAILTAENPKGKGQSEAQNKAANDQLIQWLKENGYVYHEVTGKFGSGENSILVENMSRKEARDLARIFDQHSVATKKGLVKSDGSSVDFKKKVNITKGLPNSKADNYTTIKLEDGTVITVSMDTKVKGKGADKKNITTDEFFNTGSENFLVKESQVRISDSDAVVGLEKSGTKPKGKDGEYTAQQISDKKIQLFNDAAIIATQGKGGTTPVNKLPDMTPGTKAWEKMLAGVDQILRNTPEGGPKTIEVKPPTINPYPVDNTPKGPVRLALNKLGNRLRGIRNNWLVTNPMGYSERGWNIFKRREGPKERAGDIITLQGRDQRVRDDQLNRDALEIMNIFKSIRRDDAGKRIKKDVHKRNIIEINEYLRGNDDARISFLSEAQRSQLDYARQKVDGLTEILIDLISSKGKLSDSEKNFIQKLRGNQGTYLKRSYEAFSDNGKWIEQLNSTKGEMPKAKQALIDDAARFVMEEQGKSFDDARAVVRGYIQDLAGGFNSGGIAKGQGLIGALDTRMFKGRKEIPEAFRKLLGEIEDPIFNYAATVNKLGNYVGDWQFQNNFSNHLIETGLGRKSDANGNGPQGWERLAVKGKAFDVLSDVWVPKEFKKMYNDMQPLGQPGGSLFRLYLRIQGTVKGYKTVFSPGTIARNMESGILLSANAGHFALADFKNIGEISKMAWGDSEGLVKNRKTMESDKLKRLGVIGDTARAGEYMMMMRDFSSADAAVKAAEISGKGLKGARKRFNDVAQKVYAFGDDYYKLSGYYQEVRKFLRDDPNMSRADAEIRAAERIRGGYPTYSGLPRNIKRLRRFPLTGMFVSFAYEVPRTTANNVRYAAQDLREGRTQMGIERLLGLGLSTSLISAMVAKSQIEFGWDDDDTKAIQGTGAFWDRNSQFVAADYADERGEDGVLKYVNLSSIVPNETFLRPIRTLFKDGAPTLESTQAALLDLMGPYIALDATTNFVNEMMTGQKKGGGTIGYWDKDKHPLENIDENWDNILKHMMVGVGPGYFRNIQDFARANKIMPEFFGGKANEYKEYTNEEAFLRMMGISIQSFDLGLAVPWKVSEEARDYQSYKKFHEKADKIDLWMGKDFPSGDETPPFDPEMSTEDRIAEYNGVGPDFEYLEEYGTERARKQYNSFVRAQGYADLAFKSGISQEKFLFTLQDANISKADAQALWVNAQGEIPLSLAKKTLKEERFVDLRNQLGWENAPKTVDDVEDPTKSEIAEKREQMLETRGDRDVMPWAIDVISKERTNTLRERVIYIQEKLGSDQTVIDAKILELYNTIGKVNSWYLDEWVRLAGKGPGLTPEEQKEANRLRLEKLENEQEKED
jgi:hypothetical protein